MPTLSPNGLSPHEDFPSKAYEAVHAHVVDNWSTMPTYSQYTGAWNALAYRFQGVIEAGARFQRSLKDYGSHPSPQQRYQQEEALFSFFSNGFSAFEAAFYAFFAVGSFIEPMAFPLVTLKDQQRVSPLLTAATFKRAFPDNALLVAFAKLFAEPSYQRWRNMRNVLTHRAAPGRRVFVGFGTDDAPPVEWKLNDLPLDSNLVPHHQRELAQLITDVVLAFERFLTTRA